MNEQELQAIEERANAATPGPWVADFAITWNVVVGTLKKVITRTSGINNNTRADAEFIAAARADVPALIAEVRSLRAAEQAASEANYTFSFDLMQMTAEVRSLHAKLDSGVLVLCSSVGAVSRNRRGRYGRMV